MHLSDTMRGKPRYMYRIGDPMLTRLVGILITLCSFDVSAQVAPISKSDFQCEAGKKGMDCYWQMAATGQMLCDATAMLNRAELKAGKVRDLDRVGTCVREAQAAMKKQYPIVLAGLKGKPKAQELLKDHYSAWRAHLDMMPTVDPSPELPASSARLREKTRRLETELE